jgi:aminoglycoside phosphotransferase (APT) family kinase protein
MQEQEWQLMRWAREQGVPTAEVIDLIQVEGFPVLVVEVVDDDGSVLDGRQFGRVVARLHQAPAPAFAPVVQQRLDLADRIAARLTERHRALKKYGLEHLPDPDRLAAAIRAGTGAAVVNHLDLRRQNVRCLSGEVKALFDWSNALIAPAEVELARLTEYAEIPENGLDLREVLAGYREAGGSVRDDSDAWAVLRLDAAVMLANVFDQVAPNPDLRDLFVERARGISL